GQRLGRPPPIASNIEALRQTLSDRALLRSAPALAGAAGEQWQEQIEVDRVRQDQAFLAAVRRDVGDADRLAAGDASEGSAPHGGAVGEHAEPFGVGGDCPAKTRHEVFLPMTDESADPEYFSAMEREVDAGRSTGAKAFRLEDESLRRLRGVG